MDVLIPPRFSGNYCGISSSIAPLQYPPAYLRVTLAILPLNKRLVNDGREASGKPVFSYIR